MPPEVRAKVREKYGEEAREHPLLVSDEGYIIPDPMHPNEIEAEYVRVTTLFYALTRAQVSGPHCVQPAFALLVHLSQTRVLSFRRVSRQ